MSFGEPCMCGATDCPSCGRDQGYRVEYSPTRGYYNPEPEDDEIEVAADPEDDGEDE